MKKTVIYGLLLIVATIVSCTSGDSFGGRMLSPEQERLARINMIDSTSLSEVVNLDSIDGFEQLSSLTADVWMLIDDSTGCIISEKNADEQRPMASITKMMTCLLALENGQMNDTIEITQDVYIAKDSRVKLGDKYTMRHLIDEMMLLSDNDAAYALAKHIGGDTLKFCDMMNEKAAYLGMTHTHFANPNGMPNLNNYSTASDLVRLSRYCMRDSLFAAIVGTAEKDVPLLDGRHMPCRNTNALLKTYEGCLGIKTGFTRLAGNCLASAATRNGTTLYLVLLNSRSMSSRFTESAILLDYGFNVMKTYGLRGYSQP
ncbi:MAG: D-alanyl-D-alanine carboxypeptidase [Prevotella sp.]|nr:D-alanyl-D-alanine carboxypeptidase [Prevotella sp.]